jgi:hypothetical protein
MNAERSDSEIPDSPQHPPLMIFYEDADALKYYGQETDIVRAHRAARRLFDDGAVRVLLINGVQEILRPDDN